MAFIYSRSLPPKEQCPWTRTNAARNYWVADKEFELSSLTAIQIELDLRGATAEKDDGGKDSGGSSAFPCKTHESHNLNSLKGVIEGLYKGVLSY